MSFASLIAMLWVNEPLSDAESNQMQSNINEYDISIEASELKEGEMKSV